MALHYVESVMIYPRLAWNNWVTELQISVSNDSWKWVWVAENKAQGVPQAEAQVNNLAIIQSIQYNCINHFRKSSTF